MCQHDHSKRDFLIAALSAGTAAGLPGLVHAGQSKQIAELRGDVQVNGQAVSRNTVIRPGDDIKTGAGAKLVFVVGKDAIMLRENSRLILQQENLLVSGLRLLTGAMMAVFAPGPKIISTPTATAGIRGTGIYVEAQAEQTYFCTCYGEVELKDTAEQSRELVQASQHKARYVKVGQPLEEAPMLDHTDDELELLEALVGRTVPF